METITKLLIRWTVVSVIFCGLLLCGCASPGVAPVEKISTVEKAIQEARDSNATVSAPLELRHAEDKLKEAKSAMKEEEFDLIADTFRDPRVWRKENGEWIKDNLGDKN